MSGEAWRRRVRALLRRAGKRAGETAPVERAFVHQSYTREHGLPSNERLEFLGDAVLGFITAAYLHETFPDADEGALTVRKARIVNDEALARTAERLGFADLVLLGTGMRNAGGAHNVSILAGAFEAFTAALFLAYGLPAAQRFVVREHIAEIDLSDGAMLDAKTRLQHYAQEHFGDTPVYRDVQRGTAQRPDFISEVLVGGRTLGTGSGPSKKAAQQAAAAAALRDLHDRREAS
jgi:ribonuclease-3